MTIDEDLVDEFLETLENFTFEWKKIPPIDYIWDTKLIKHLKI